MRKFDTTTMQGRLRHWRENIQKITLDQLCDGVNAQLPDEDRVTRSTINNYEARGEPIRGKRVGSSPRIEWVLALGRAFPINLEWYMYGTGQPQRIKQDHLTDLGVALMAFNREEYWSALERSGLGDLPSEARDLLALFARTAFGGRRALFQAYDPDDDLALLRSALARNVFDAFKMPFSTPGFLNQDELTQDEVYTYSMAYVAALRPLLRRLRPDADQPGSQIQAPTGA